MINVDEKRLLELLGFPGQTVVLANDHERRAARVITDGMNCQSVKEAVSNAASWTAQAYQEGFEAGKLAERDSWRARIAQVFGL